MCLTLLLNEQSGQWCCVMTYTPWNSRNLVHYKLDYYYYYYYCYYAASWHWQFYSH